MTTEPTKGKQPNLTSREKEALILEALKWILKIQENPTLPEYVSSTETAWDKITSKVNDVNTFGVLRSKYFIRKKFRSWISEVKGKLSSNTKRADLLEEEKLIRVFELTTTFLNKF